jgi:hypothetical protein
MKKKTSLKYEFQINWGFFSSLLLNPETVKMLFLDVCLEFSIRDVGMKRDWSFGASSLKRGFVCGKYNKPRDIGNHAIKTFSRGELQSEFSYF